MILLGVQAAVIGNVAGNLVSFDVTPTAVATWLLSGLGVSLASPSADQTDAAKDEPRRGWWLAAGVGLAGLSLAVWQSNGRPLLADIAARSAVRAAQQNDIPAAITWAERAVSRWPVEPVHHLRLSQNYWQQASSDPAGAQFWLGQAEASLETAAGLRPEDPAIWLRVAQFYTAANRQFGSETRSMADAAYGQAVTLSPNDAAMYTAWGGQSWKRVI